MNTTAAVISLIATILGLVVKWYFDEKRKKAEQQKLLIEQQKVYEDRIEKWSEDQIQLNELLRKQDEKMNEWIKKD